MTIDIEKEVEYTLPFDYKSKIEQVILAVLDAEQCPYECAVNVLLTDNAAIWEMNREYRNVDRPTDVLSFPMCDYEIPGEFTHLEEDPDAYFDPETGELQLGDIVISLEKMSEQAKEYGHSELRELCFLVAHSMLHLCGYDHMEDEERLVMENKQEAILTALSITRES